MGQDATASTRLSRPNDARALRSREALRKAFLTLVEQRPLDRISIRDITAEAGVSYPVFFRRFASKEELLEDVAAEEVRHLLQHSPAPDDGRPPFEDLCLYVEARRALWKTLLTTGAAPAMRGEFMRIARGMGETQRQHPWLPLDLTTAFVTNGIFEILAWWLRQPEDYPIRNVMKILEVLIVRSLQKPDDIMLE